MNLAGAGFGAAQALTAEQERKLREFQVKQNAEIARGELARRVAEDASQQQTQMRTLDLADLKRRDALDSDATQRNAASDMAGVLAMPGMSNQDKANEIMGSGLRTGSVDPMKVIEGLTRIPPQSKPGTHVVGGNLVDDSGKVLFQAQEKPTQGPKPGVHVINGSLVDDNGRVIYQGDGKDGGGNRMGEEYQAERESSIVRKINDLIGVKNDPNATNRITPLTSGTIGAWLEKLPFATEAKNVGAELQSLAADVAFMQLQKMRNASKTGGSLGQVSDFEGKLLANVMASIRQDQTTDNLIRQLGIVRDSVSRFETEEKKYGGLTGAGLHPVNSHGASPSSPIQKEIPGLPGALAESRDGGKTWIRVK